MTVTEEQISAAIASIYSAASGEVGFDSIVRHIRSMLGASSGLLFTPCNSADNGGFGFVDHFDVTLADRFRSEIREASPWELAAEQTAMIQTGRITTDEMLVPDRELRATAFYHEAHIPLDVGRLCCAVLAGDDDAELPRTYLSIYRGIDAPPFEVEQLRLMRLLAPHLRGALRLARRFDAITCELDAMRAAVNALDCGVVFLDTHGCVTFLNNSAERLCVQRRGLQLVRRHGESCELQAVRANDNAQLQAALATALAIADGTVSASPAKTLVIHHQVDTAPLSVSVLPLPSRWRGQEMPGILVMVEDLAVRRTGSDAVLSALYAFTPAECRVARALLDGLQPKAIAEHCQVSEHTVRSQIRALYNKTSTRGMAALLAVLHRTVKSST